MRLFSSTKSGTLSPVSHVLYIPAYYHLYTRERHANTSSGALGNECEYIITKIIFFSPSSPRRSVVVSPPPPPPLNHLRTHPPIRRRTSRLYYLKCVRLVVRFHPGFCFFSPKTQPFPVYIYIIRVCLCIAIVTINHFRNARSVFQQPEETPRATSVSKRSRAIPHSRSTTEATPRSGRSNVPCATEVSRQRYDRNRTCTRKVAFDGEQKRGGQLPGAAKVTVFKEGAFLETANFSGPCIVKKKIKNFCEF